jgi:hypothetical protein
MQRFDFNLATVPHHAYPQVTAQDHATLHKHLKISSLASPPSVGTI